MNGGFSEYDDLESDGDFIEDYEDTSTIPKKDWFKPSNASLARLEKVKPVATVYNLGLRDPRDLQAGRGKTAPVPVASPLLELQTEPPLSTVSYQKAAWGSQTSIPELLKQAAQAGTKPSRPSSAKTGTASKLPLSRKVRPQSAKDPLCPPGKKKNGSTFGVKGQKYDPSDRAGKFGVPSLGSCVGWAGPPAGLCDPSGDAAINFVLSANSEQQKSHMPPPPPPNTSPEPEEGNTNNSAWDQKSPPRSPVCLSLSLPSAEVDASDDMDTGRLLEEATKFTKEQKKKEFQRMKYFKANEHSPRKASEPLKSPLATQQTPSQTPNSQASRHQEAAQANRNDVQAAVKPQENGFEEIAKNSKMQTGSSRHENITESWEKDLSSLGIRSELSLDLESALGDEDAAETEEKPLPPSNGFDLEYLGPAQRDRKNRSHPIFLMPDTKPDLKKRPLSSRQRGRNDLQQNVGREGNTLKHAAKEPNRESLADAAPQQKTPPTHVAGHRSGVQIREDCNVTVNITPRNIGRKVTGKSSGRTARKGENDLADFEIRNDYSGRPPSAGEGKGRSAGSYPDLEINAAGTKNRTVPAHSVSSATPVSVVYDDDDGDDNDNNRVSDKKKARRRRGLMKEKDLVTMVSDLSLGDEVKAGDDFDDPGEEVDILLKDSDAEQNPVERGRSPSSTLSRGERNYYDIGRKQTKDDATRLEEKENFITMTTKTILFDTEKPTESVVKTILDAPLTKSKEHAGRSSPEKLVTRPRSGNRLKCAKLSKSNMHSITPVDSPLPANAKDDNKPDSDDEGGFTASHRHSPQDEEDRPESRMGFVPMGKDGAVDSARGGDRCRSASKKDGGRISQRPPSGKRRPLSAASKTLNRPPSASNRQQRQNVKENVQNKRRPMSASSALSQSPSSADIHRANAAAQALRSEREAATKASTSGTGSNFAGSQRHYASYSKSGNQSREQSASRGCKPVFLHSNKPDLELDDTESMEECKEIQTRLARYGIDVKPQTLERALFPPTGKTLYYQVDAQLPASTSYGLLSHPRYWLPEEHKRLRIAEKKLAMAELSLWKQKKAEERKARLAAEGKEKTTKKGKKKGKKKLKRRQSIC